MATATVVKPKIEVKKVKKEPDKKKTILVEMLSPTPKVTFTGGLWTVVEVKQANRAIIVAFKKMLRELYRKEYKK